MAKMRIKTTADAGDGEALTALEEELVRRKQKELAMASEREKLQRELAGLSRVRLEELKSEQAAALAGNASSTAGWWQIDDTGQPTPPSGSGVQMLFWDFTNASARQYYQEQVRSLGLMRPYP